MPGMGVVDQPVFPVGSTETLVGHPPARAARCDDLDLLLAAGGGQRDEVMFSFHEAGHAVAALYNGWTVELATIEPGLLPSDGTPYEGRVQTKAPIPFQSPRGGTWPQPNFSNVVEAAVMSLAGPASQRAYKPRGRP